MSSPFPSGSRRTWRDAARPIIARVIATVGREHPRELRQALQDAYPWGPRENWPYKIWLSEIRYQLGLTRSTKKRAARPVDPQQQSLF